MAPTFPHVVVEGWWRRARRDRAVREFAGWTEVFCRCDPPVAEARMRTRAAQARHPIHRDVINPTLLDDAATLAATVTPLNVGPLVEVDTTTPVDIDAVIERLRP